MCWFQLKLNLSPPLNKLLSRWASFDLVNFTVHLRQYKSIKLLSSKIYQIPTTTQLSDVLIRKEIVWTKTSPHTWRKGNFNELF